MTKEDIIVKDPRILGGIPVIKGTRIPVTLVKKLIKSGYPDKIISLEYPSLTKTKIRAFRALI